MEKQIKAAAKLYQCRDTAKKFFKDEYKEKLKPYTRLIQQTMAANKEDEIKAAMRIVQLEMIIDNGMAQMLTFAAVVEMIEPSV